MSKAQKETVKNTGMILLIINLLIAGSEIVLQKTLLNNDISPNSISMYRMLFIVIISTIMILCEKLFNKNKKECTYDSDITSIKNNKLKYIIPMIFMGIFKTVNYYFFVNGLKLTKIATTISFINHITTSILIIVFLAMFIPKEKKNLKNIYTILAIPITILGIMFTSEVFLSADSIVSFDIGTVYVLISTIFWALYILFYTKYGINASEVRIIRDAEMISFITYFAYLICTNNLSSAFMISKESLLGIFIFTLIIDIGSILTYYRAIRVVSGTVTTLFSSSSPVISFALCYLILNEKISTYQFIGCILLLVANILLTVKELKEIKKEKLQK